MKLILKSGQEIEIDQMSNLKAFTELKDGYGVPLDSSKTATFTIINPDSSIVFDALEEKLSNNTTDFKLSHNGTERTFPDWKIASVSEEITDERRVIIISLVYTKA